MASGTSNVSELEAIIQKAENGLVLGTVPGALSLAPSLAMTAAAPAAAPPAALTAGEALLVQNAIQRANAAAPVAAAPGAAPNIPGIIDAVFGGLTKVASTPADIKALAAGADATLKWWGWTLDLSDHAAKALQHLLANDLAGLLAIATALAALSPPLAAIAAIVGAVANGLSAWIAAENSAGKGVRIRGYLWVGVLVTSL